MDILASKRLDHLGIVSGTMSDLGLMRLIDQKIPKSETQKISTGDAVGAMILNSLGFTSRPLSLTPQFFESKALDLLFDGDVEAADLNRHRLGRSLDEIYEYGCDLFFHEVASDICHQEKVDNRFLSLDTTSFSVTGDYAADTDEAAINITYGYSKDHRSDLKQVVSELLVSQDGGIPLISKTFDGNESDNKIFKERCEYLVEQFKNADGPRYLVADSKLYHKDNAVNLSKIKYITRIPRTNKEEREAIQSAIDNSNWVTIDNENKYFEYHTNHLGIPQRWLVIHSQSALDRSKKTLEKQIEKEHKKISLDLKHLRNKEFKCKDDALNTFQSLANKYKYHRPLEYQIEQKGNYAGKGRPLKDAEPESYSYFVSAEFEEDAEGIQARLDEKS